MKHSKEIKRIIQENKKKLGLSNGSISISLLGIGENNQSILVKRE